VTKPEISVFIPVYKESFLLPDILSTLITQDVKKEIFVIIDEPTEFSLTVINEFKEKVKFIVNNKRVGKVNALNNVVKQSSGEILLFLDADIEIKDSAFLKKIEEELKDADILDIKKEVVKDSFLAKMAYYEYVGINMGAWMLSKFLKKCPSVNGSAFAIKRDTFESLGGFRRVIVEDVDLATRAFINGAIFKYSENVKVYNHVHSSFKNWLIQRKRWSVGTALWFKEWYKPLLKTVFKTPQIIIPALFFLFPSLLLFLLSIFAENLWAYKLVSLVFLFFAVKVNAAFPFLIFIMLSIDFIRKPILSMLSFFIFSLIFYALSKKLGFTFKIHEFFIYYFIYSPLNLFITINGIIRVFIFNKKDTQDWKV